MDLRETPEQLALRSELREYFHDLLPEKERREACHAQVGGPRFREITKRLGQDGWLGIGWPTEYGGQGRSIEDQYVFFDELQRAGIPFPFVTVNTVGPTLMAHGSQAQKDRYLPGMLAGDIVFSIGYTEAEAGTDLASLRTRAVPDGAGWRIDGAKVFTTGANTADYVWLAVRTDQEAVRQRGISIMIVPTAAEGFSWTPIHLVAGNFTTSTYYHDVAVPAEALVGELNGGWSLITTQLNHERIGLAAAGGRMVELWHQVLDWARTCGVAEHAWVRRDLAECRARLDAMELLNWKMTAAVAQGTLRGAEAGGAKIYGTETQIEVQRALLRVLGAGGRYRPTSRAAVLAGEVEQISRQGIVNTFGGGVNEVLRDMVATMALGLPRAPRLAG